MRPIATILILAFGIIMHKHAYAQTHIPQLHDLKKTNVIKFGGGDVWGTTTILNNPDSSVTKVIVDYDAGDYGKGRSEYVVVDNNLVYQRDSIVSWVIDKSPLDSNEYKLSETVCHFNKDGTGSKISKAVYSTSFAFNTEKINELKNKKAVSDALTASDYLKKLAELKDALERTLTDQ